MEGSSAEALRPILLARKLSRFRVLDVACTKDHRLVQVIKTGKGLVSLFRPGPEVVVDLPGYEGPEVTAEDLEFLPRRTHLPGWFTGYDRIQAYCRCGIFTVDEEWMQEQIDAGRRRAVWG